MHPKLISLATVLSVAVLFTAVPVALADVDATLAVSQTDSKDPAPVGKKLTYTFTVENLGPDDAPDVSLTVDLPGDACPGCPVVMTFKKAWTRSGTCADPAETIVVCQLGTIPAGDSVTVKITIVPQQPGTLTNRGYATLGAAPFTSFFAQDETTVVVP